MQNLNIALICLSIRQVRPVMLTTEMRTECQTAATIINFKIIVQNPSDISLTDIGVNGAPANDTACLGGLEWCLRCNFVVQARSLL